MRDHQRAIRVTQWLVVGCYLFLIIVPALLPLPPDSARLLGNLTLFAQFLFWGIWWPFVLLSMVLIGRTWCGVFCPEGALSEWASSHGRGAAVPRWAKWAGWPFAAFCLTTVFGQLVSVYQYPKAALLVLGGSTVAAMLVGFLYGKSKRVWCRHLCPVNGVFGLLARLSPVYMQVDRQQWTAAAGSKTIPVNCAPLVDIRRMQGPSECHQCGRCSGHRDAVQMAVRAPNREISTLDADKTSGWDLVLLAYGMLGVALGAFQWSANPWFISAKQAIAGWLIDHDILWPLNDNAPWWLLTHYPENNDVFSWLDGAMIAGYITLTALLTGSWIILWLAIAGRQLPGVWRANMIRLGYALTPIAGCGVFLGLSALTFSLLKAEGIQWHSLPLWRGILLGLSAIWSVRLAWLQTTSLRAVCGFAVSMLPVLVSWGLMYYVW